MKNGPPEKKTEDTRDRKAKTLCDMDEEGNNDEGEK